MAKKYGIKIIHEGTDLEPGWIANLKTLKAWMSPTITGAEAEKERLLQDHRYTWNAKLEVCEYEERNCD